MVFLPANLLIFFLCLLIITHLIMPMPLLNISIICMLRLDKIILNNDTYKLAADAHRKHREFNEGDYFMVCICPNHYPKHDIKKLHA